MRMRGNGEAALMMDLLNHTLRILVWIDCLLQVEAQDMVIFEQITDLQARNDKKVIRFFRPTRNLIYSVEITFQILDGLSLIVEFKTSWRLRIEQMVCD